MIALDTALNFFIINISICLIPCAEMIIVITQSTTNGWKSGMAFVAGICLAVVFQVILMAFGISAIIQTSALVFNTLKVFGVCYLLFLAWQVFAHPIILETNTTPGIKHLSALFRKGLVVNLSNPMTPLFLLILIPPFIRTENGSVVLQSLELGFLVILAFFCVYTLYSITAEKIGARILQSEKTRYYLQRGAASTIAGFAIYLALAQQSL